MPGHLRLRGGKNGDGATVCDGERFAIQHGLLLGGSRRTDVFELQLAGLADDVAAMSIVAALRTAFCWLIGIQEDEVGVTVRQARAEEGGLRQSMFLYDMAGTAATATWPRFASTLARPSRGAVAVLQCRKECDAACEACLLTFGSHYEAERLDRHRALEFAAGWTGNWARSPDAR